MRRVRRNPTPDAAWLIAGAAALGAGLLYLLSGSDAEASDAVPLEVEPIGKTSPEETDEMPQPTVFDQIRGGNVPGFLRDWKPVPVSSGALSGTIFVSPDFLGVGRDADYLRTPMTPGNAQRLGDQLGFVLPTKKMVEAIEAVAIPLPFHAHAPTATLGRNSVGMWTRQNDEIRADLAGREGQLAAGHKKDIVVGGPVLRNPGKVIIFGGRYASGGRVQPQSGVHSASYMDYSHGVRMIRPDMIVVENGIARGELVKDVLADPRLAGLLSDEGATRGWRYPT